MNVPLHDCIRPGLVHMMAFPATLAGEGPIEETLKTLLDDEYFEVVEIAWIKDSRVRARVKQMLAAASGVEARYIAHPRLLTQQLDLNSLDPAMRGRAVAAIKHGVDEAVELGLNQVALLSGRDVAPEQRPQAMAQLAESLQEICAYAEARGVRIALEVFDRDVDKKCLIGPARDAQEICARVKRTQSNFGLIVDLSHIPLLGETPAQALIPVREHLWHVHIGNCCLSDRRDPAWGDQHPRFGYPGGVNDVAEITGFLRVLFEIGYLRQDGTVRGAVSFEIKPQRGEDPATMIAGAKRKLNAAWRNLRL